jgi:hypothetical protein
MVTRATYSLVPPSLLCFAYAGEPYAADKRRVTPITIESLMIPLIGDKPRSNRPPRKKTATGADPLHIHNRCVGY